MLLPLMGQETSRCQLGVPAPKKANGPWEDDRPMAIVVPNGEALWFTVRSLDEDTPRLVISCMWSCAAALCVACSHGAESG